MEPKILKEYESRIDSPYLPDVKVLYVMAYSPEEAYEAISAESQRLVKEQRCKRR